MTTSSTTRRRIRLFLDFEREERWLNEMSAEGWALVGYTWGRYRFAKGEPGMWTYRLALLPNSVRAKQSREFLDSVTETGAELVVTYASWAYFRKRTAHGAFEVFGDVESRLAHHSRVAAMYTSVAAAQLPMVVVAGSASLLGTSGSWVLGVLLIQVALLATVAWAGVQQFRRVAALKAV